MEPQEQGSREACEVLLALSKRDMDGDELRGITGLGRIELARALRGLKERGRIVWDDKEQAWRCAQKVANRTANKAACK